MKSTKVWFALACLNSPEKEQTLSWLSWGPYLTHKSCLEIVKQLAVAGRYRFVLPVEAGALQGLKEMIHNDFAELDRGIERQVPKKRMSYHDLDLKAPEWKDKFGDWIPQYKGWGLDSGGNVEWVVQCRWCFEEHRRAVWKLVQGKTLSHRFCPAKIYPNDYSTPHPKARLI